MVIISYLNNHQMDAWDSTLRSSISLELEKDLDPNFENLHIHAKVDLSRRRRYVTERDQF